MKVLLILLGLLLWIRPQNSLRELGREHLDGYLFEFTDECAFGTTDISEICLSATLPVMTFIWPSGRWQLRRVDQTPFPHGTFG
jgi:hypothetical protein